MKKEEKYKVGQIIRNKKNKSIRRVTKVVAGRVSWISDDGSIKGQCDSKEITRWQTGR